MTGFQAFTWKGKPIRDIRAWTKKRGEQLVFWHAQRTLPNPFTGRMATETKDGYMPEQFWNSFCATDGWHFVETRRENP